MRPKTLMILGLIVALLGAFIFFYEKDLASTDERREAAKKVLQLDGDEVVDLSLAWDDHTVRFSREAPAEAANEDENENENATKEGGWRLVEPFNARADSGAVDSLLTQISSLEKGRTLDDLDPADAGLDDPRAVLTLTRKGKRQTVLEIGNDVPASSQMLVRVDRQGAIHQVGKSLLDTVTKDPGDWRDRSLVTAERGDIARLSYADETHTLTLADRDGSFFLEEPVDDRADSTSVDSLLASLVHLEASTFIDDPLLSPDKLGLEPARATLDVELKTGDAFRLAFGDPTAGGQVYARVDGQLVEIAPELPNTLARPTESWRSTSWTSLQVFGIDRFEVVEGSGAPLNVERSDADWMRGDDRIPYSAASDFLYALTEARADQVLERQAAIAAGFDLESPRLTVRLGGETEGEELQLFAPVDGHAAATVDDRAVVLLLPDQVLADLEDKLLEIRTAEPLADEPVSEEDADGTGTEADS